MIAYEITAQNNELIRNQIGAILTAEFENQAATLYNTDCENVTFWIERITAIDKNERTVVNVSLDQGDYGNRHSGSADGKYKFFIDCMSNSKSTSGSRGDKLAGYRVQRVIGICRAILENPIYERLSFAAGFIMRTMVTKVEMLSLKNENEDAMSSRVCRLYFEVWANEAITLPEGNLLTDSITQIKIGISDKGIRYVYGTDAPSPVDNRYAKIVDQYRNVLALLEGGDEYSVTRILRIVDSIINNTVTVTDNIIPET